jgi:hypothetical protein
MESIEQLEIELESVHNQQRNTIENYCNSIGCRDCPLSEPDGECHSTQLVEREYNIQDKIQKLKQW